MATKLYVWMYPGRATMPQEISNDDIIDDIIKSKSKSKTWTTVTSLIFKLERQTKVQNVGNWTGYLDLMLNLQYNFRLKRSPGPQNGGHFENLIYLR